MKTVIKVDHLSKEYRLGEVGTGTFSRDLNSWWAKLSGKEDPNAKIDLLNNKNGSSEGIHKALTDVSFEVQEGEVLGIIGKNGAGKSTLLKVLSRVTTPTAGEFKVRGRIASLLEVGTGFHPELTGRENIFLNGAILGMKKAEISRKFDEIVDFSGVEKFIDTPVKRYSSGMYVRLAFAVAAHLEPEILVVDEVLAVGDIAFQNKCMGKMNEVSKQGRTILFVSHNMQALSQLCTRGILLQNGSVVQNGSITESIRNYLSNSISTTGPAYDLSLNTDRRGTGLLRFTKLEMYNKGSLSNNYVIGDDMELRLTVKAIKPVKNVSIAIHLYRYDEIVLANIENIDSGFIIDQVEGETTFNIKFSNLNFYPETYKLGFWIASSDSQETHDHLKYCAEFHIMEGSPLVKRKLLRTGGSIYLTPEWGSGGR
ncbi:MAG: ABC transporter ATP-binding protein [Bacteroidia bacterium]